MENKKSIQIPKEIHEYLWTRYLPETTYKMYVMIGYLKGENVKGQKATNILLQLDLPVENNMEQVIEEKKKAIEKFGYKYPTNRTEDLELLLNYKLIKLEKDEEENIVYVYNTPVPKPEEILSMDQDELEAIENIKFEIMHQNAFNMILTLILNNNGKVMATLEHIHKNTRVKLTEIKSVLSFLINEGSISIKASKSIDKLKKEDKIYININKEVFEQKRFVVE